MNLEFKFLQQKEKSLLACNNLLNGNLITNSGNKEYDFYECDSLRQTFNKKDYLDHHKNYQDHNRSSQVERIVEKLSYRNEVQNSEEYDELLDLNNEIDKGNYVRKPDNNNHLERAFKNDS